MPMGDRMHVTNMMITETTQLKMDSMPVHLILSLKQL